MYSELLQNSDEKVLIIAVDQRFINNERNKNSNNNENNKNNTETNNSKNVTNNPIEALVNNPLIRLLEQSSNQNQNALLNNQNNQPNQNQLLKNLTLLANVQNTNFNNTINSKRTFCSYYIIYQKL